MGTQAKIVNLTDKALHNTNKGVNGYKQGQENIIVSLTTYSKKIYDVFLVVESIFEQTLKPDKLILWLAEDEFKESDIPLLLKKQQERGLEIAYCKDIKSYKKLIPTLQKYPEDIIITVDDDVMYPVDLIENLTKACHVDPSCIHYYKGWKMTFDRHGKLHPYHKWQVNNSYNDRSFVTLPTGVKGILYPPHCFYQDVTREDLFMKLCPLADDIWFKAMTLLNDVPCNRVPHSMKCLGILNNADMGLHNINVYQKRNDTQIKAVFDHYNLWEKLKR
jgi:hypothetical protein